ncbi:hypothetical protein EH223_10975 [candidate division KSB1 bacterium]|nr:hypothetical protein [candidate division KSB1 bacterium]RQW03144.1 MAG: hypothetical protein EH223_10975 [candidate division KSB1 bacterium]
MEAQLIQKYIQHTLSEQEKSQLREQQKTNPALGLLVKLVNACLDVVVDKQIRRATPVLTAVDAEILLIRLLSFHINKKDAARFLASLAQPTFYQRALASLKIATMPESELSDAMPEIRIQTDAEIYRTILSNLDVNNSVRERFKSLLSALGFTHIAPAWKRWSRRPAWVALVSAVCLVAIILSQWPQPKHALYVKYIESAERSIRLQRDTPHPYSIFLRSVHSDAVDESEEITTTYKLALASYMNQEYEHALPDFEKIENMLDTLEKTKENAYFLIDFYFYYGMAHLNLVGTRGQNKDHLNKAIRCFSQCRTSGERFDIELDDDILFYTLLAHDIRGDTEKLDDTIQRLLKSPYSNDVKQLINH